MLKTLTLALVIGLAACTAPPQPQISTQDGWARETGQSGMAAAYVTIRNQGGADQLTGVSAEIGQATLHESSMEGGIMRMRPIDPGVGLTVPSNGKLMLAPGGAHVMITALEQPLRAGDEFDMTLRFERSRPKTVRVKVRPAAVAAGSRK